MWSQLSSHNHEKAKKYILMQTNPEVNDFKHAIEGELQIRRFDVAMNNSSRVAMLQEG